MPVNDHGLGSHHPSSSRSLAQRWRWPVRCSAARQSACTSGPSFPPLELAVGITDQSTSAFLVYKLSSPQPANVRALRGWCHRVVSERSWICRSVCPAPVWHTPKQSLQACIHCPKQITTRLSRLLQERVPHPSFFKVRGVEGQGPRLRR